MIKSRLKYGIFGLFALLLSVFAAHSQNLIPATSSSFNTTVEQDLKNLLIQSEAFYSNKKWAECDSITHILIQHAINIGSRYYEGQGYLQLGKLYSVQNQDRKSYLNFLRASKLFDAINDYQYLAEAELEKGVLYNRSELWKKAYLSLSLADSLYQSVHFTFDLVKLYGNLGKAALNTNKTNDALLYLGLYRRYSVVYQKWDDQKKAINMLVKTYRKIKDYTSASQYDMELIKTLRQKNTNEYYHAIKELANDFFLDKKYAQAETNYKIVYENSTLEKDIVESYLKLSDISSKSGSTLEAISYLNKAWAIVKYNDTKVEIINQLTQLYISQNDYDKAKEYNQMAISLLENVSIENKLAVYDLSQEIALAKKDHKEALKYTKLSAQINDSLLRVSYKNKVKLAELHSQIDRYELSKQFEFIQDDLEKITVEKQQLKEEKIQQELQLLKLGQNTKNIEEENLRLRLKQAKKDALLIRQKLDNQSKEAQIRAMQKKDTISRLLIASDSIRQLENKQKLDKISAEKRVAVLEGERAKRRNYYLLGFLVLILFSLFVFLISLQKVKKTNILLAEKNKMVSAKHKKLTETHKKLKAAEQQLIETERLASLGQLTAGIAHEIRNPLNFVNNFAQLSKEYAEEIQSLIASNKEDFPEEMRKELSELTNYLNENSAKIMAHGSRAARIITRMLETASSKHSAKEPTNLNLLLEDSINLAYQGVRGENADFISEILFNLDKDIPEIPVVAQDMGRVFINIANNACQALLAKAEKNPDYNPILKVSSKQLKDSVWIEVYDNGNGIPEEVQNKIFNPFFTTKPPGKGTGLGLTMSFEIVEKTHGGKIRFESRENEFTKFIIELPKNPL